MIDLYQSYIHKSRYARYLDDKKRREHLPETFSRYIDYLVSHVEEIHSVKIDSALKKELYEAIVNFDVMGSMRAVMTAGKALDRDNTAAYNPVREGTLVLTKEHGLVPIETLTSASVLNKDGKWVPATFRGYGKQKVLEVKLRLNSNTRKTVFATPNHRWITSDGSVKPTEALQPGDHIPFVSAPKPSASNTDYRFGVLHGLVYGDGTASYSCKRVRGYNVRLCGDHDDLLPYFDGFERSYPQSAGGDPVIYLYDDFAKTHELKSLPSYQETPEYLLGFIRGWMAADGYVSKSSQASIAVNEDGLKWLSAYSESIGFVIQSVSEYPSETNFGARNNRLYRVSFSRSSLTSEDFLISRKREMFRPLESTFSVVEIVDTGEEARVFCAEVPDTNTFVLDQGLVTGNCSYLPVDDPKAFDEAMHILMCGTGVGFSVERQYVNKLPEIPDTMYESDTVIVVKDSKEGWAKALRMLLALLYSGEIPKWDTSKLRPAGSILKTFGGRSSGPEPLIDLFKFVVKTFRNAAGRKLTSLECHDIMCKIGEVVVVGGVRRSAMISLSNLSDDRMRHAKSGAWWEANPQRALSNNSAVYTEKPDVGIFMQEWMSLYESKSGERGIVSREAMQAVAKRNGRRDPNHDFGTNPCSEIILRPYQFCNLTEVILRADDTEGSILKKIKLATILGTFQSTLTHFPYLRKVWQKNTEEERLLGVSMTGIYDCKLTNDYNDAKLPARLEKFRQMAVDTNKEWAEKLGIPVSSAITCVKPSGTVSQLVDSASGIHPRHDPYYLRRVRSDNKDPLTKHLIEAGIPAEPDVMKPGSTTVFTFPKKAPEGAVIRSKVSALDHLNLWLVFQRHYCEHKPSVTINVKEDEWPSVGAWVWDHFDEMSGVSFLPFDGGTYRQAPYETITKEEYDAAMAKMPTSIDWDALIEVEDNVEGTQTLACTAAGGCEI